MNYKSKFTDTCDFRVVETKEDVDGFEIFATFTEAKTCLVKDITRVMSEFKFALAEARKLKKKDVQIEES